ncbi:retron St85 family RNA-directed DNA polymerase [uncultured Pseudoalteromonas sp.]|uniref:retron St85 family RNA-directed DNA polymerase n=1 Tax=uncultured Pseudoalteromonas sp. TaxID=114053 RepID=UPI0025973E33|nr:retron St85 family RNA-directed DNA polymerase [uncultured Pseudoalteromonas sp.]
MNYIGLLAERLNKTEDEVSSYLLGAPLKYKVYNIPKRTSGYRVIAQPSKELKKYQRKFLEIFSFAVHNSAKAYKKDISIKDNALVHSSNQYLLKMDFENFFNSIDDVVFWKIWAEHYLMPDDENKLLLERLLFWSPSKSLMGKLVLSIGAPSSPMISNFIMHNFDDEVFNLCKNLGINYSRYADDLTFSTNIKNALFEIPNLIIPIIRKHFNDSLKLNRRKTVFASKAHNRHVTGVTIANDGKLSIGRERKRYIKHLVHQYILKNLESNEIYHLKGLLAFSSHIEPVFLRRLEIKYSKEVLKSIFEESYEET